MKTISHRSSDYAMILSSRADQPMSRFETVLFALYVLLHDAVFYHLKVHLLVQNRRFQSVWAR